MKERMNLERTEVAQVEFNKMFSEDKILMDVVVSQVQSELAPIVKQNPNISSSQIKQLARDRFLQLLNDGLLSEDEANKCYQRFIQMVDYYYGTS